MIKQQTFPQCWEVCLLINHVYLFAAAALQECINFGYQYNIKLFTYDIQYFYTDVIGAVPNISNTTCPSQCSKDFYCKSTPQGLICAPTCNWKEVSDASSDTTDILVALLVAVGVIVAIIVLITACVRRKRV